MDHCLPLQQLNTVHSGRLAAANQEIQAEYIRGLKAAKEISDRAESFLQMYCEANSVQPAFAVPVRQIAAWRDLKVVEQSMMDEGQMEFTALGAGSKLSQLTLRERSRFFSTNEGIAGTIAIEQKQSEYSKRLLIALELGRFVMRKQTIIGQLTESEPYMSVYASYGDVGMSMAFDFALALLMPYSLVETERHDYERSHKLNPLSYFDWIQHLADLAQIPDSYAMLGYEQFKKCQLARLNVV